MADNITATFKDEEVRKYLKGLTTRLSKAKSGADKKIVGLLSAIVYADVNDHFSDEAGPQGDWANWSKSYLEHMQKIGRSGNKKLQFSGKLRQNFKPTKVKPTLGGLLWFNDAKTSSGFAYAGAHDEGDGRLPQREFMWLSNKGMDKIEVQTLQFMLDEGV